MARLKSLTGRFMARRVYLVPLHRANRRVALRQRREGGDGERLYRRANAKVADLLRVDRARLRDEFGGGEAARASLARTHAAARESLQLVGTFAAERHRLDDLARAHRLATAHDGLADRAPPRVGGPVERVEECAAAHGLRERGAR